MQIICFDLKIKKYLRVWKKSGLTLRSFRSLRPLCPSVADVKPGSVSPVEVNLQTARSAIPPTANGPRADRHVWHATIKGGEADDGKTSAETWEASLQRRGSMWKSLQAPDCYGCCGKMPIQRWVTDGPAACALLQQEEKKPPLVLLATWSVKRRSHTRPWTLPSLSFGKESTALRSQGLSPGGSLQLRDIFHEFPSKKEEIIHKKPMQFVSSPKLFRKATRFQRLLWTV